MGELNSIPLSNILGWLDIADEYDGNPFIMLAFDYFAFNFLLRFKYSLDKVERDRVLLNKLKEDSNVEAISFRHLNNNIKEIIEKLILKPVINSNTK